MTGTIHVEEVVILEQETVAGSAEGSKPKHYRRLVFRRNPNLIQSEASLVPMKVYSKERGKNGADVVRRHSGNKKKHRVKDAFKPGALHLARLLELMLFIKFCKPCGQPRELNLMVIIRVV